MRPVILAALPIGNLNGNAQKRPGAQVHVELEDVAGPDRSQPIDLLAIDEALTCLAALDPRASRVVELRFFGGLVETETAEVLGVSVASVKRDRLFARAWLLKRLETPLNPAPQPRVTCFPSSSRF